MVVRLRTERGFFSYRVRVKKFKNTAKSMQRYSGYDVDEGYPL